MLNINLQQSIFIFSQLHHVLTGDLSNVDPKAVSIEDNQGLGLWTSERLAPYDRILILFILLEIMLKFNDH
jgi:hypothetical protein